MFRSPDSRESKESEKLRVLVVDDEPTLRLGFAYALSSRGTVVETAATGRLALERMAEVSYDIMILDLRMPELDGSGVIETLRSQGNLVPIILCSTVINPKAALHAIRHGVVDFLLKPVRPSELRDAVISVIRPDGRPLQSALKAARAQRVGEAIQILESVRSQDKQMVYWLSVFRCIHEAESGGGTSCLEENLHAGLSVLAFNAPSNS
jgi:CheY-like chemotaxis protein